MVDRQVSVFALVRNKIRNRPGFIRKSKDQRMIRKVIEKHRRSGAVHPDDEYLGRGRGSHDWSMHRSTCSPPMTEGCTVLDSRVTPHNLLDFSSILACHLPLPRVFLFPGVAIHAVILA